MSWIDALKVGDRVVIEGEGTLRVGTVSQIQAKCLFVGLAQFSRKYGTIIEKGKRRDFIRIREFVPGDDERCERETRRRFLCRHLRGQVWDTCPLATLERIYSALTTGEKGATNGTA